MIQAEKGKISTIVISTALGPGGRGIFPYTLLPAYRRLLDAVRETGTTVFTKSATRFARKGNFIAWNPLTWKYIRRLPDGGMLNAYGLTNPGVAACAREIKAAGDQGFQVIPNLYPEFAKGTALAIKDTLEALEIYQQTLGAPFWALELNFSCPNSQEAIRENVAQGLKCTWEVKGKYPDIFLIAKISICHPYEFAQELENLGVGALHAVNTIPFDMVYPQKRSPLWRVGGGGVSGGPAFAAALEYNTGLRKKVGLPLIMGCGVRHREDVQMYLDAGADAVSLCTLALRNPGEAAEIIDRFHKDST
ncbi:MAG: HisA/HisF-related TIM barrel protein [Thermodesulfobacteriota bacterium]